MFKKYKYILTVEDGVIKGGFGSAVLEFMAENELSAYIKVMGIPDKFIEHGTPDELYKLCGIDHKGIAKAALKMLGQ